MHKLLVMDSHEGHRTIEFAPPDVTTKDAVRSRKSAEKIFNEVMGRGLTFVAQAPASVEGKTMKKFDPHVEEAIAITQVMGG